MTRPHMFAKPRQLLYVRWLLPALLTAFVAAATSTFDASAKPRPVPARPTIVLVHGAFADASGFGAVERRLTRAGYRVIAPADPLRGLESDAASIAGVLATIPGPVVLVGHSYGGAVASQAAAVASNVKALVFLNAFALDHGESALELGQRFQDSQLASSLVSQPFTTPDGTQGIDLLIDPAKFRDVFAADLSAKVAARLAINQRPVALAALAEPAGTPGWRTIPSSFLIGDEDHAIDPAGQRFMARRAGARTLELPVSHASFLARPSAVATFIMESAEGVG